MGIQVRTGFVKAFLISCCALLAPHALAQSSAQQRNVRPAAAPVDAARAQTVAAGIKGAKPSAAAAVVTAAGSVIVLADGIVANATMAQVQPPADGFVYER
jgi:CubicO group peptidase (beta-lactamase class C family)